MRSFFYWSCDSSPRCLASVSPVILFHRSFQTGTTFRRRWTHYRMERCLARWWRHRGWRHRGLVNLHGCVRVSLRAFPLRGEDAVLLWAKGIDAELLHFFVEGGSVDSQLVGGNVPIPLIGSKDFEDDLTFGFLERLAQ